MAITAISRDWGVEPSIVRITTTDDLTEITTSGYLTAQANNIALLNNGAFEWLDGDYVLIYYADGEGFFTRDAGNETFDAAPASPGTLSDTLQDGHIFVGNALNVATDVTPSGDITLTNTGVFGIAAGAIVNADINASAAIAYSKLAALPSANIIVGSVATVPTARAMSGDATLSNLGALTIVNNAITSAKMATNLLQYVRVNLTAAQWNGMYAAPVLLVPAAGANTIIVLAEAIMSMTFVSAAYAAGGVVAIQYDSTIHGAGATASNTEAAADFFAAASTSYQFTPISGNTVGASAYSVTVNKGLYLSNQTGAFTTGDGTWHIDVWYRIISSV